MHNAVVIKSSKAGMNVIMDPGIPFDELLEAISKKFSESARFWGSVQMTLTSVSYTHLDVYKRQVQTLKSMGCHRGQTSMQGLGYKEILDYLDGRCTLDEAVYVLKRDTRHLAKRQLTWFKRERDVRWLNLPDFGNDVSLVLDRIIEDCVGAGIVLQ